MVLNLLKKYTVNYFVWWYVVKGGEILMGLKRLWLYGIMKLNIGPMFVNMFRPMYQDPSLTGRLIAFPIRFTWVIIGSVLQLILMIISSMLVVGYFLLPGIVFFELIWFLSLL